MSRFSRFSLRHPLKNFMESQTRRDEEAGAASAADRANSRVVAAALVGNVLVCGVKAGAAYFTCSGVLLAETFHSMADVVNQTLLMVGIKRSLRRGDALHPYGYGPLKPAFALMSATGVFFLGCGASVLHGVDHLVSGHVVHTEHIGAGLAVVASSLLIEGVTCYYALRKIRELGRLEGGMTVWQYLVRGRETTSIAVFVEDAVAVGGLLVAGATLWLTQQMGSQVYDAAGTIVIGVSMGALALFLISRNLQSLLGYRLDARSASAISTVLSGHPSVRAVHDVKTLTYGPRTGRFKAEIEYDGRELARMCLHPSAASTTATMPPGADGVAARAPPLISQFLNRCNCSELTPAEKEELLLRFGAGVVNELAMEVDRVETEIKTRTGSEVRHVDLESHASPSPTLDEDSALTAVISSKLDAMASRVHDQHRSSSNPRVQDGDTLEI